MTLWLGTREPLELVRDVSREIAPFHRSDIDLQIVGYRAHEVDPNLREIILRGRPVAVRSAVEVIEWADQFVEEHSDPSTALAKTFFRYLSDLDVDIVALETDPAEQEEVVFVRDDRFLARYRDHGRLGIWLQLPNEMEKWAPVLRDVKSFLENVRREGYEVKITGTRPHPIRANTLTVRIEGEDLPSPVAATIVLIAHGILQASDLGRTPRRW